MGGNPHANGGLLLRPLRLPDFERFAGGGAPPGETTAEATRVAGSSSRR
jgi:xylulose-5-phosphate/fructose-6-phosphate phosphoketolase